MSHTICDVRLVRFYHLTHKHIWYMIYRSKNVDSIYLQRLPVNLNLKNNLKNSFQFLGLNQYLIILTILLMFVFVWILLILSAKWCSYLKTKRTSSKYFDRCKLLKMHVMVENERCLNSSLYLFWFL